MKNNKDGFGVTADFFGKRMFSNLEEQKGKHQKKEVNTWEEQFDMSAFKL